MCFQEVQAVESQVLSTRGQPDVNLRRLTEAHHVGFILGVLLFAVAERVRRREPLRSIETTAYLEALARNARGKLHCGACAESSAARYTSDI